MYAISMTRFLDPIPPVFPPKTFGTDFLSSDIVWLQVSQVFQNPFCKFGSCSSCHCFLRPLRRDLPSSYYTTRNFRNKLILDWSLTRTHHKCFVETWKCGGHRSNGTTTRAPNHQRQVFAGDCVEFIAEMRGPDDSAMFVVLPLESQWEGRDLARALEIACAKELLSPRKCKLMVFRLTA